MDCYAIVLAAGKGTRMKSRRNDVSKVAYPLLGKPMVSWVVDAVKPLADKGVVTVVGFAGESVERIVSNVAKVVWQREQKGTGDAVKCAKEWFEGKEGCTIIVPGDRPLLQEKTLAALLSAHEANHDVMTVLSVVSDAALPGKIVKEQGRVVRIAKTKGDPEAKASKEINLGVYVIDNRELFSTLATLEPGLGGEYHLADLAEAFSHQGKKVSSFVLADPLEGYGVNDRLELSAASAVLQERINAKWMRSGVTIEDPRTAYIAPEAKIGPDTVIRPNTHIYGESKIGENNVLGPDSYFDRVEIGDDNVIEYCHLVETKVGNKTTLGPWLRARKNAVIHDEAHIGNFNELKNVEFGVGSKCAHLSYLGDARLGDGVNVGCGSIIANYDGVNKFHSDIGDHAFIGSGTILVSPVRIEDYGFTAAGSTITGDVPPHSMAIARARQVNKEGFADVFHEKALEKKKTK